MQDAKRFLRYVVPGLVIATEALVIVAVLDDSVLRTIAKKLLNTNALAVALAGLATSGGIGYLASVLHHTFHWFPGLNAVTAVNHSKLVSDLQEARLITVRDVAGNACGPVTDRWVAWNLTTALWRTRQDAGIVKAATPNLDSLADLMHSAGSSTIGVLMAGGFSIWLVRFINHAVPLEGQRLTLALAVTLGGFFIHYFNYRRVGWHLQAYVYQVLYEGIDSEVRQAKKGGSGLVIRIDSSVFKHYGHF